MYKNIKIIMILTIIAILFTGCGKDKAKDKITEVTIAPVGVEDETEETEEKEEFVDNNQTAITDEEDDGLSDIAIKDGGTDEIEEEPKGITKEELYNDLVSGEDGELPLVEGSNKTIDELKEQIANTTEEEAEEAGEEEIKAEEVKKDDKEDTTNKTTTNPTTTKTTTTKPTTTKPTTKTANSNNNKAAVTVTPKRTDRAAVNFDGTEIVTSIKINNTKRGSKAVEVLEDAEDTNGASFGTVANKDYEIVIVNFTITLPSNIVNYNEECIPEIRVRGTDGKLLNGEAVYIYVGELKNYKNDGRSKTYDIVFEIPKKVGKYSIQFGISGADNYVWYSK